eukprot:TRINITY_DN117125_c0_g1_i1.p2 TRINITY_DN117125_c0_g1~~TRINITY_DN117125_c0_g1_i1.p2  ORF type:complete len:104 (-),score=13.25 TRINITY_DN117125_c0_g1_i1:12-323(-)
MATKSFWCMLLAQLIPCIANRPHRGASQFIGASSGETECKAGTPVWLLYTQTDRDGASFESLTLDQEELEGRSQLGEDRFKECSVAEGGCPGFVAGNVRKKKC